MKKASPKILPVLEKKLVHKDYSTENEQKEENQKKKSAVKCSFGVNHKKKELAGLLEEQIAVNLEKSYLLGTHCSAWKKVIISKKKLIDEELATETMFNRKLLLLTCDNCSGANGMPCTFCMYHQCFIDTHINAKKDNNKGARRSRRSRK